MKRSRKSPITSKPLGPATTSKIRSKYTRRIIRKHHTLLKEQARLESELTKNRDEEKAKRLEQIKHEIQANGGLDKYQQASISGQDRDRGGDSSKVLVSWLKSQENGSLSGLRLLEVGSLSPDNAVSTCGIFSEIDRIDLHSQHPLIREQDFLKMPIPTDTKEKFDVISLSLVVNYVANPVDRGEMLRRTVKMLRKSTSGPSVLPGLFLVLPAPCTNNSRYFTEQRLSDIMVSLGYSLRHRKETSKLVYWYWTVDGPSTNKKFKKQLLNDGRVRNNFTITLD